MKTTGKNNFTESEGIFRSIFENSGEAILITHPNGAIYSANMEACRIFGMSEAEICNLGRDGIIDITDSRLLPALKVRQITGKFKGELTLIRKDGAKFPAEVTSTIFRDAAGDARTAMIIRDITQRKKAEMELHLQSEIMKNITEGINLVRQNDNLIVFTNPKFDVLFGYETGELIGKKVAILNAPTGKRPEETKQDIIDILNRTGEWHGEILNIKKNGSQIWCYVNISMFIHQDYGRVYLSVHSDITDRKQAEANIKESEARFRSLFENSLLGISITSPVGKLILVNNAYAQMYGYENPEKMLAEVISVGSLYANPADREEVLKSLQKNSFMAARELNVIRRDGSILSVLVTASAISDNEGNLLSFQATHLDLTDRKKYEEKIHAVSFYARNLIEASLDPLVTINADGKITDVNLATEQITGYERNRLIGSDFSDYFTEPQKAREGYKIVFHKGLVKDYPLTLLHKSGKTTPVLYNATLFKNESGEVQGVFAAARDITFRKKMEEELRMSSELLEKLNQHLHDVWEHEKAQLAMNIHDDLGQKLTALNMDLAWMKSRMGVQSQNVRKKLNEMSFDINETIDGIKEISALLRPAILFDLGLIPAITSHLNKFEKQSGIKCKLICDPEEFEIDDRLALILYRIIQESLTNAARHSKATSVQVSLKKIKSKVELLITDNGIGIDRNKVKSASSLGIAGIKERVNLVNGKMLIRGVKKSGTTIKVTIPFIKNRKDD